MPSGFPDTIANAVLDSLAGSGAGSGAGSILPATMYLDLLTTAPSDDNGTGAVSWGQGRLSVATVNGTNWPAASGRAKTGAAFTLPTNSSGSPITTVAFAWFTTAGPTGGTYKGGGPVPGSSFVVPDGATPTITPTLSAPSP